MKLDPLIIGVGLQNLHGLDLEGLILDIDLMIFLNPSSSKSLLLIICYHLMGSRLWTDDTKLHEGSRNYRRNVRT